MYSIPRQWSTFLIQGALSAAVGDHNYLQPYQNPFYHICAPSSLKFICLKARYIEKHHKIKKDKKGGRQLRKIHGVKNGPNKANLNNNESNLP